MLASATGTVVLGSRDYDDALKLAEDDKAVALPWTTSLLLFGLMMNSRNPAALEVVGDTLQRELIYGCMLRSGTTRNSRSSSTEPFRAPDEDR